MLTVRCPKCDQLLNLREQHLGVKGRCLHCRVPIIAERCAGVDEIQVRLIHSGDGRQPAIKAKLDADAAKSEEAKAVAESSAESLWPGESDSAMASIGASLSDGFGRPSSSFFDENTADPFGDQGRPMTMESPMDPGNPASAETESDGDSTAEWEEADAPKFSQTFREEPEAEVDLDEPAAIATPPVDNFSSSLRADAAAESVAASENEIVADTESESASAREIEKEESNTPVSAPWASIIRTPSPVPTDVTAPPLFEEIPEVSNELATTADVEADDAAELAEDKLPIAASMVIEAPSLLKEHDAEAEAQTGAESPGDELGMEAHTLSEEKEEEAEELAESTSEMDVAEPMFEGEDLAEKSEFDGIEHDSGIEIFEDEDISSQDGPQTDADAEESPFEPEAKADSMSWLMGAELKSEAKAKTKADNREKELEMAALESEGATSEYRGETESDAEENPFEPEAKADSLSWLMGAELKSEAKAKTKADSAQQEPEMAALESEDTTSQDTNETESDVEERAAEPEGEIDSLSWLREPELKSETEAEVEDSLNEPETVESEEGEPAVTDEIDVPVGDPECGDGPETEAGDGTEVVSEYEDRSPNEGPSISVDSKATATLENEVAGDGAETIDSETEEQMAAEEDAVIPSGVAKSVGSKKRKPFAWLRRLDAKSKAEPEKVSDVEESESVEASVTPSLLKNSEDKAEDDIPERESECAASEPEGIADSDDESKLASEAAGVVDDSGDDGPLPLVDSEALSAADTDASDLESAVTASEKKRSETENEIALEADEDTDVMPENAEAADVDESDIELPAEFSKQEAGSDLETPIEAAEEKFESVPTFGPEFVTTASSSKGGTQVPASEWTPFEFSDAETNEKPAASMNPITPSNPTPDSPFQNDGAGEHGGEAGGDKEEQNDAAVSPAETGLPSQSDEAPGESDAAALASEGSQPQTVKKSVLPPLVGMAGVAAFPRADRSEGEKNSEPQEQAKAEPAPVAAESKSDSIDKEIEAPSSSVLKQPADQSDQKKITSPVDAWMAGRKMGDGGSEETKDSEAMVANGGSEEVGGSDGDSTVLTPAENVEEAGSGEEEVDPGRADALARFAARIDGAALENSSQSSEAEKGDSESDSSAGLLPWEKVEQEKAKAASRESADPEEPEGKVLKSDDGNVRINLDDEPKEEADTFVNHEHKSAEMTEEEAALEAEYASTIMGQANGGGAPMTNYQRRKRLKKKRRRRVLMVLFVMFLGSIGALMYFKPGFRPKTFKAAVTTSWKEGKTQFDNRKLTDFSAIVDPLIEIWNMGPDGSISTGEKDAPTPGSTATAQATAPATPPKVAAPPKPAPVAVAANPPAEITVTIPAPEKPGALVARPVALPQGEDGAHAAAAPKGDGATASLPDSSTHPAPGETEEQRSTRVGGEKVLKDFYAARTAEEKLASILNPNKVAAEIEDAYPTPADAPTIRSMEFKGRLVDSGTQRAFGVFDVRENENGDRHRWCVPEVSTGEFKIDWGLYRQLANDELTRFLANPKSEPKELRLLLRRGAEVAAEKSPWNEPSLELLVLMPLDDGSPSRLLITRAAHDELGLNRDLGDGMARVGSFRLSWEDGAEENVDFKAAPTIIKINNWGAWAPSKVSAAEKQTSVTPDPDAADEKTGDQ